MQRFPRSWRSIEPEGPRDDRSNMAVEPSDYRDCHVSRLVFCSIRGRVARNFRGRSKHRAYPTPSLGRLTDSLAFSMCLCVFDARRQLLRATVFHELMPGDEQDLRHP